jgi:hypothetical protein
VRWEGSSCELGALLRSSAGAIEIKALMLKAIPADIIVRAPILPLIFFSFDKTAQPMILQKEGTRSRIPSFFLTQI